MNKKIIFPLISLLFLIGAVIYAVSQMKQVEVSPIATSTPVTGIMRVEKQEFATTTAYAEINIEYPKFIGDYFAVAVIEKVNADIKKYAMDGVDEFMDTAKKDVSSIQKTFPDNKAKYEYIVTYELAPVSESMVQIYFGKYTDTGGAHGLGITEVYRVERATGDKVGDEDVFADLPGIKFEIHDLVRAEVISKKMTMMNMTEKEARDSFETFTEGVPGGWSGFAVLPEGVEFIFAPYTLGAYVEGEYRVIVPWQKLAPYLQTEFK